MSNRLTNTILVAVICIMGFGLITSFVLGNVNWLTAPENINIRVVAIVLGICGAVFSWVKVK